MKKISLLLLLFSFMVNLTYAQRFNIKKANKLFGKLTYADYIAKYEPISSKPECPSVIRRNLADSYYFIGDYANAVKWYKQVEGNSQNTNYLYRYAQSLRAIKRYDDYEVLMQKLEAVNQNDTRVYLYSSNKNYLKHIEANSGRFKIDSLPINSVYSDFGPSVHEKMLIFSSARDTGSVFKGRAPWNNLYYSDFYTTNIEDEYKTITRYKYPINTKNYETTAVFTKNGETVYFTRSNSDGKKVLRGKDETNHLKIYKADVVDGQWLNITPLAFNGDDFSTAHPALSPKEDKLYFTSNRPGSYGNSDLFVVNIKSDGTFGPVENLGAKINTEARETFPFIDENGDLYFSSDGHPGLGGLDVYVSKINEQNYRVYNIGKPINSNFDDFSFTIQPNGKGYFASNRDGGMGDDDIYAITQTKPLVKIVDKTSIVGVVTDADTKAIIPNVNLTLLQANKQPINGITTAADGSFKFLVDSATRYIVKAGDKEFPVFVEYETKVLNIELKRPKVEGFEDLAKSLDLKPIYFDFNKSTIKAVSKLELDRVVSALIQYPNIDIQVRSHTDCIGTKQYNFDLSDSRAKATVDYIISKGINPKRLTAVGMGESYLIKDCCNTPHGCTSEDLALNRRSEFLIFKR